MDFSHLSYGVIEDDGSVPITILLSGMSSVPFQVLISTVNMTALGTYISIYITVCIYGKYIVHLPT